jgi:mRNA interferase MazF
MNVGDVHWVEFPPRGGHEQAGRRPAILAQGAQATVRLPTVLLIPMTTQQDALRFPGTVFVDADSTNGLSRASVALVFQLTAVDLRRVGTRLGRISDAVLQALWVAFDDLIERGVDSRQG